MDYPATRAEAKATGATHYFTGKPCKYGHVAPRLTKGTCTVCREIEWKASNEKRKGKPKSEAAKAAGRRYYLRNREQVIAAAVNRPRKEKHKHRMAYKNRNPELFKLHTNIRRKRLRDASPPWLTKEQKQEIRKVYASALNLSGLTGERYEVDHIIPLVSDQVCGLHVPWNLQVLTKEENLRKHNSV
jgi:hypothetical protein